MSGTFLLIGSRRPARTSDGWRLPGPTRFTDALHRDLSCPVHRDLERWTLSHLGSISHERRVAELATDLFDVTQPLHGLSPRDLRLLRWAATVHDVGRAVCDETHPEEGAAMIRGERSLPLTPTERRELAFLTLHHRGKVPATGRDGVLGVSDDGDRLRRVLALLRVADALDNRRLDVPPRVIFGLTGRPGGVPRLRIDCHLEEESARARRVFRRRKKFRLLEELLGCEVAPQVITSTVVRAVA